MAKIADMTTPYTASSVDKASTVAGVFEVPPVSWANLIDLDEEMALGRASPAIAGALFPESKYLEPTIGQIWPR